MMHWRVWKLTVLCLTVSAVLLLGIAGVQAQTRPLQLARPRWTAW